MKNDEDTATPDPEAVRGAFEENLSQADAHRLARFEALRRAQEARRNVQLRQADRLSALLGGVHPDVLRTLQKVAGADQVLRAVAVDVARAKVAPPLGEEGLWVVHGHIRDAQGSPKGCLVVEAWVSGKKLQSPTLSHSNAEGYYLSRFQVPGAAPGKIDIQADTYYESKGQPLPVEGATPAQSPKPSSTEVVLRVVDRHGQFIQDFPQGLEAKSAAVDFVDLVLGEDCGG